MTSISCVVLVDLEEDERVSPCVFSVFRAVPKCSSISGGTERARRLSARFSASFGGVCGVSPCEVLTWRFFLHTQSQLTHPPRCNHHTFTKGDLFSFRKQLSSVPWLSRQLQELYPCLPSNNKNCKTVYVELLISLALPFLMMK